MSFFISVLISEEQNVDSWVFAQRNNNLAALESDHNYTSISKFDKNLFNGNRADNKIRTIHDGVGMGAIDVVSYEGDIHAFNALAIMSKSIGKREVKRLTGSKKITLKKTKQ